MESAIPAHLQCPRSRPRRVPDDYVPPYPSFVARHAPTVQRVVMAYFGVQSPTPRAPAAEAALAELQQRFGAANGPRHWDRARYTDEAGHDNVFGTAYWDDPSRFDAWFAARKAGQPLAIGRARPPLRPAPAEPGGRTATGR